MYFIWIIHNNSIYLQYGKQKPTLGHLVPKQRYIKYSNHEIKQLLI